jgi:3',5'-cyclic AMP phosphodiesterase CpdA
MKIVAISDTHEQAQLIHLPPGDVLIHAGDITNRGSIAKLGEFTTWLKKQPHTHKVVICGNHDFCFENANHDIAVNMIHEGDPQRGVAGDCCSQQENQEYCHR